MRLAEMALRGLARSNVEQPGEAAAHLAALIEQRRGRAVQVAHAAIVEAQLVFDVAQLLPAAGDVLQRKLVDRQLAAAAIQPVRVHVALSGRSTHRQVGAWLHRQQIVRCAIAGDARAGCVFGDVDGDRDQVHQRFQLFDALAQLLTRRFRLPTRSDRLIEGGRALMLGLPALDNLVLELALAFYELAIDLLDAPMSRADRGCVPNNDETGSGIGCQTQQMPCRQQVQRLARQDQQYRDTHIAENRRDERGSVASKPAGDGHCTEQQGVDETIVQPGIEQPATADCSSARQHSYAHLGSQTALRV